MKKIYKNVLPKVHFYLNEWKRKASQIPDDELRKQALASIHTKTFHCEGGGIYAILAGQSLDDCIEFIVAYQTISDYLDNLCDRSTSLDPVDFRSLHESMLHALTPGVCIKNYYQHRIEQDDGGYLRSLVETCQQILMRVQHYDKIAPFLHELATYYCDLQVYKHIKKEERVPKLKAWFEQYKNKIPDMAWYEFSACAGSTLGIFCLVAYAFNDDFTDRQVYEIRHALFPYVQGLHILLDYFIDQEEDRNGGDLNFCFYFPSEEVLKARILHFLQQANLHIARLPDEKFHRLINHGLIGLYLSDAKVRNQREVRRARWGILKSSGIVSTFFYLNGRWYRKFFGR
ncbi:MAG TPA: tetraprenyl-beta-curcumene synthase family protein [Bacillus bacterium]|nr:tetraprenyl-beta-curcumene synthase family protein [Bacillus sp. (in: firmicutes)]